MSKLQSNFLQWAPREYWPCDLRMHQCRPSCSWTPTFLVGVFQRYAVPNLTALQRGHSHQYYLPHQCASLLVWEQDLVRYIPLCVNCWCKEWSCTMSHNLDWTGLLIAGVYVYHSILTASHRTVGVVAGIFAIEFIEQAGGSISPISMSKISCDQVCLHSHPDSRSSLHLQGIFLWTRSKMEIAWVGKLGQYHRSLFTSLSLAYSSEDTPPPLLWVHSSHLSQNIPHWQFFTGLLHTVRRYSTGPGLHLTSPARSTLKSNFDILFVIWDASQQQTEILNSTMS